jgi:hypothetical protein
MPANTRAKINAHKHVPNFIAGSIPNCLSGEPKNEVEAAAVLSNE